MKYLHVMHNDKFIPAFIEFINKNFDKNEQKFLIIDGVKDNKEYHEENVVRYISKGRDFKGIIKKIFLVLQIPILYIELFFYFRKSKKIILHGLFDPRIVIFLYIFRNFLKKTYWGIWGGDLYSYTKRNKKKLIYKIEDYIKGNMKGYITQVEGDFQLAQQWFKAKGKFYYCLGFPSNLYKDINFEELNEKEIWIQIGNSADPSNNHFEILDKLSKFKDMNIKLFCILSYGGNKDYNTKVINKGKEIFKNKFCPILEYMGFDDYIKFLSSIDIAIFAHDRQQGFGNVISFLGMGKTVYLKEEVTTYETLTKIGIKLKPFKKLEKLEKFSNNDLENNKKIVKANFLAKNLKEQWENVFEN